MHYKPLVISFSGGRTSAYMAKYLKDTYEGERQIITVFANTGREREETLQFVNQCDKAFGLNIVWLESVQYHGKRKSAGFKVVDFETADRTGAPFEDMIKKHGIPNVVFPHCSRELKSYPIKNYIASLGIKKYEIAIGIRADEPKRLKKKPKVIYPLAYEKPTTQLMVNKWWVRQPFNLNLKGYEGNCDMCWKKSNRKHMTLLVEKPELMEWWNRMEITYGEFVPPSQAAKRVTPITFFRGNTSIQEILEDSKTPFTLATDDFSLQQLMEYDPELDFEDGSCGKASCEAF